MAHCRSEQSTEVGVHRFRSAVPSLVMLAWVVCCVSCSWSEQDRVSRCLRDLSSKNASVAMRAQRELISSGSEVLPAVERALRCSTNAVETSFLILVLGNIAPDRYAEVLCEYASSPAVDYSVILRYVDQGVISRISPDHRNQMAALYASRIRESKGRDEAAMRTLLDMLADQDDTQEPQWGSDPQRGRASPAR